MSVGTLKKVAEREPWESVRWTALDSTLHRGLNVAPANMRSTLHSGTDEAPALSQHLRGGEEMVETEEKTKLSSD